MRIAALAAIACSTTVWVAVATEPVPGALPAGGAAASCAAPSAASPLPAAPAPAGCAAATR